MNLIETPDDQHEVDLESISQLIPKTREGDDEAREHLMRELQSYLEWITRQNMYGDLQQKIGASDVVQMAFVRIVERFDQFRGGSRGEFYNWLKTIVVNEIRNARRMYATGKRDVAREKSLDDDRGPNAHRAVDAYLTPSSQTVAAERRALFREVMQELTPEHAEVIQLRSIEELSFREIGERMDRTPDAVNKLWFRAMLKLEEKLKTRGEFDDA